MVAASGRATNLRELFEKLAYLRSGESVRVGKEFRPRPDDVIVATYAKAGTTWMQQIVHGLRTRGDMDFDEISAAVPWIEMAHDLDMDLEAEQAGQPRAFKTHFSWHDVPKGARYIFVFRDPKDSAVSFYNFTVGWLIEPGGVTLDEFVQEFYIGREPERSYWYHLLSWWPRRTSPDTLFCCYEEMKDDLSGTVRRVADFIGITDEAAISIATHQASFEFMKAHEHKFDEHLTASIVNPKLNLTITTGASKVVSGQVGTHKEELSAESGALLDQVWADTVGRELGFASYEELRSASSA